MTMTDLTKTKNRTATIQTLVNIEIPKGASLTELAKFQIKLKGHLDFLNSEQAKIQKVYDELRKKVLPDTMENLGVDSFGIKGEGKVSLRPDMYVRVADGKKEEVYTWLEESGHGDLIQDNVNPSTLKAFIKEQIKKGEELPEDLFKISPFMMAIIKKS